MKTEKQKPNLNLLSEIREELQIVHQILEHHHLWNNAGERTRAIMRIERLLTRINAD